MIVMNQISSSEDVQQMGPDLKVVLTGNSRTMAHKNIIATICSLSGKPRPHLTYLGTPSKDSETKYKELVSPYEEYGCHITKIDLYDQHTVDTDYVATIVHQTDIILISGGSYNRALVAWRRWSIDQLLIRVAYRENPPLFVGGSAGAYCLTQSGLRLVPITVVCHYDTLASHPRVPPPNVVLNRFPHVLCIGLDENAALIIHGKECTTFSVDGQAKCYRVNRHLGNIESSSLPYDNPISLTTLTLRPT